MNLEYLINTKSLVQQNYNKKIHICILFEAN